MQNGRKVTRFQASRFTTRGCQLHSQPCAPEFRYRHVLVPTSLDIADRATLLLGFELASLDRSTLTLLHVLPRPKRSRAAHGLDAFELLHAATEELLGASAANTPGEVARFRLRKFVEDVVPSKLRSAVNWRGECRPGSVAETIVSYVNESGADLVVLSAKPFRSWLPLMPVAVRTIERLAQANVIVIRGQSPTWSS